MNPEQLISRLNTLHLEAIACWKMNDTLPPQHDFLQLVIDNHHYNYQLWHEEDKARRDDMGFEFVYHAKRRIDSLNQSRNNCMEIMDQWLQQTLDPADPVTHQCPVHSETPGMIIDRLSILSLKHFHMKQQTLRTETSQDHRESCLQKFELIEAQRNQLLSCLHLFLQEILDKKRTFKLYHQLKMYNDKNLNPELYSTTSTKPC